MLRGKRDGGDEGGPGVAAQAGLQDAGQLGVAEVEGRGRCSSRGGWAGRGRVDLLSRSCGGRAAMGVGKSRNRAGAGSASHASSWQGWSRLCLTRLQVAGLEQALPHTPPAGSAPAASLPSPLPSDSALITLRSASRLLLMAAPWREGGSAGSRGVGGCRGARTSGTRMRAEAPRAPRGAPPWRSRVCGPPLPCPALPCAAPRCPALWCGPHLQLALPRGPRLARVLAARQVHQVQNRHPHRALRHARRSARTRAVGGDGRAGCRQQHRAAAALQRQPVSSARQPPTSASPRSRDSTTRRMTAWLRLLSAFIRVPPTLRLRRYSSSSWHTCGEWRRRRRFR